MLQSESNGHVKDRMTRLAVLEIAGTWRVLLDGKNIGRFDSQIEAKDCALDIAGETRREGSRVEILIHGHFGELRALGAVDLH